jgi:hypothetical protein
VAEFSVRRVAGQPWLVVLVVAAAIGLAACGGGSGSPQVASLATSSGNSSGRSATTRSGSSTTAVAKGDPTRLLDEWATCMRAHGDPSQADPSIDANRDIVITWDPAVPGGYNGTNKGGQGNLGPGQFCRAYLEAAQLALQGGHRPKLPDQATAEKFSECMRADGIPDFPDPTANGLQLNGGGDLNGGNPTFQTAGKLCSQRTGVHFPGAGGTPPAGIVRLNGAAPPGGGGSGAGG